MSPTAESYGNELDDLRREADSLGQRLKSISDRIRDLESDSGKDTR